MPADIVIYESKNNIATITLNRPEKLNAIDDDMWGALEATWHRFNNSDDRVGIITGAGEKAFCVGADLENPSKDVWRALPGHIVDVEKPVIAAVFGHCLGGGVGFVQFSDLCVAAEDTSFAFPEARVGWAIGGASSLVARIPHKIAMELMLIVAVATLFSSFTTPMLAALFTLGIYCLGHLSRNLRPWASTLISWL